VIPSLYLQLKCQYQKGVSSYVISMAQEKQKVYVIAVCKNTIQLNMVECCANVCQFTMNKIHNIFVKIYNHNKRLSPPTICIAEGFGESIVM
jgi:hypothetical protein